jgi:hypothetical protein
MKNQKVQTFRGKYILPFGKPTVIVTGWETETDFYCERFVMFEKRDGNMAYRGICTHISKADYNTVYSPENEEKAFLDFMKQEGGTLAESDIFSIIVEMMGEVGNWERAVNTDIRLLPTQRLADLVYLHRKFPTNLNWLEQNTQSSMLKELITLAKRFTAGENRY